MDLRRVFSRVSEKTAKEKENDKDSFFLAVKISSTGVLATVWEVDGGKVTIGEVGSGQLAQKDYEHLLKACDQAISQASIRTAPDVEKVIFAVPHGWVHDGKIVPEHLQTLRRICKELDLVPLGYVVTTEALENFYKEVEGAPLTAILIGVDEGGSMLTIYRAGKDQGTVPVALNDADPSHTPHAIEAALKRFPHLEALPSRIILYNSGKDLDAVAQKITAHHWTQSTPFLHFPKVETAPADFVIKAVAAAGGIQMGAALDAGEFTPATAGKDRPPLVVEPEPEQIAREIHQPQPPTELEEVSPEEAGFVTQSDFDEITIPIDREENSPLEPPSIMTAVSPTIPSAAYSAPSKEALNLTALIAKLPNPQKLISKLTSGLSSLKKSKSVTREQLPRPVRKIPLKVPVALVVILLAVAAVLGTAVYFLPKANLILTVNAKNFDHQLTVAVATQDKPTTAQNSIPGTFIEASEIGTRKGSATGQKLVGEKAKGNVTIFGVSDKKTFPAETTITAPNGLKFTLDREVSVASGDATSPSTVTVGVRATNIGDTYNLPAGTKFNIGTLSSSDYLAKNEAAIAEGNSHQATVVTKVDQDTLLESLSAELAEQAKADLQGKVGPNETLLPNAITQAVVKKKFSKEVDAESDSVSLDLTMDFKGVVFSKEDVISLFATEFSSDIPQGYELNITNSQIDVVEATTNKQGETILTLGLGANLAPKIDTSQIVTTSAGKSFAAAKESITKLPGVADVKLEVQPKLFEGIVMLFLPWKKGNLKAELVTN